MNMITSANCNLKNEVDEETRKVYSEKLRKHIEGIGNLKNILTTDKYLLRFLYSTDFDVDEAFKRIKAYHETVTECPNFFSRSGPLDLKQLIERRALTVLPDCDREGRPIFLFRPANIDTSKTSLRELSELDDMWMEYVLTVNTAAAGKGICYITDVNHNIYGFIKWFNLKNLKMSLRKVANLPVKEMVIHIVNKSFFMQALARVAFPLMPESSRKQVKFHFTNWESLHKYIDPDCLPAEYGGTKDVDYSAQYEKFYDKHDDIVRNFKAARAVENVNTK